MKIFKFYTISLVFVLTVLLLINCNSNESFSGNNYNKSPGSKKGIDSSLSNFLADNSRLLHLENIQKGYNQTQIRIWFEYSLSDSGKLILMKNQNDAWTSQAYFYEKKIRDNGALQIKKNEFHHNPKSGWKTFIKKLEKLGIYRLKHYSDIKDYTLCYGGGAIIVEIATKNDYLLYSYPCYELFENLTEVKTIKNIAIYIQQEFGYKLL